VSDSYLLAFGFEGSWFERMRECGRGNETEWFVQVIGILL
jgi:hypothetical protein